MTTKADAWVRLTLAEVPLSEVVAHDGIGSIRFCRIASQEKKHEPGLGLPLRGACNYMDYSVVPVGASVGLHQHRENEEEFYLILRGRGRLFCNGQSLDVGAGDLLRNPPGGSHALDNTGSEELVMFVFEVQVP